MGFAQYELIIGPPYEVAFRDEERNFVHRHSFFEPCLVVAGSGEFQHGDECVDLGAGDLFTARPGEWHEISSVRTRDLVVQFTQFAIAPTKGATEPDAGEQRIIRDFLRGHKTVATGQDDVRHAFEWVIAQARRREGPESLDLFGRMMRLVVLHMMVRLTVSESPDVAPSSPSDVVERAIREIRMRIDGPIRVADIASAAGTSERHLRRLFDEHLHRSVAREIQEQRVHLACTLLALPELSVTEIARRVGVPDLAQFSQLFRKHIGMSPRQFRVAGGPHLGPARAGAVQMRSEFLDASPD